MIHKGLYNSISCSGYDLGTSCYPAPGKPGIFQLPVKPEGKVPVKPEGKVSVKPEGNLSVFPDEKCAVKPDEIMEKFQ